VIDQYSDDHRGWARFSDDMTMRFRLARSLDGRQLVVHEDAGLVESDAKATFLMLNPSVASAFINDPTIKRDMGFGISWGCDVLEAVNIHPLRSTDPAGIYTWTRATSAIEWGEIQRVNNEQIRLACVGAKYVIAAWGTHGMHMAQGRAVREFCAVNGIRLHHLGLTKDGHPKHPLYLKGGTAPQEWSVL
jgi:hypothetical protein